MNVRFSLLAVLLALCAAMAFGQGNVPPKITFALASSKVAPGAEVRGTVTITFAGGLHAYQNPPSEDYMIPVSVKVVGEDFKLLKVSYPIGIEAVVGGDTKPVKVYEGTIKIPVLLSAPKAPGPASANVVVQYQQCDANNCFAPKKEPLTAALTVVAETKPAKPQPVPPDTKPTKTPTPNPAVGTTKPPKDGGKPVQTPAQKPPEKPAEPLKSDPQPASPEKQPQINEKGPTKDDQRPPTVAAQPPTDDQRPTNNEQPPTTDEQRPTAAGPQPVAGASGGFLADQLQNAFKTGNYAIVVLIALLTGIALSITPCVYPMIPITVSFFSNQVAGNRLGKVGLGLMYMLGLAATYGAVGGISAALGGTIGALFQAPWFLFALGTLMAVLALSMFDVYEIRIPSFLGRQIKGRSGAVGALIMGLLMGFAAAPCAGPVVTAFAVKVAEAKSIPIGLLLFTSIGIGIGLPFFALGAFATGSKGLPKAGGWLKTLKALLGLVVLWVALNYFLQAFQMRSGDAQTMAVKAVFLVLSAIYLLALDRSGNTQLIWGLKGTAILLCGLWAGMFLSERGTVLRDQELAKLGASNKIQWQKFTPESFEAAKKSGRAILIDASADWCAVCKEIDEAVFEKPEGIAAMRNVVALSIDHSTGVDPAYIDMTTKMFGIKGLPYIQVLSPGGKVVAVITGKDQLDTPAKLQEYLRMAGSTP